MDSNNDFDRLRRNLRRLADAETRFGAGDIDLNTSLEVLLHELSDHFPSSPEFVSNCRECY